MDTIRYNVPMKSLGTLQQVDATFGNHLVEVKSLTRDLRSIKATLLDMASVAIADKKHQFDILLDNPGISQSRIQSEWAEVSQIIKPEIFKRFTLAMNYKGKWYFQPPSALTHKAIYDEILSKLKSQKTTTRRAGSDAHYEILRILMLQWLFNKGPLTINEIKQSSGFSYPTISVALKQYGPILARFSRWVELSYFPNLEWARVISNADEIRSTVRFVDRSANPRSPEFIMKRILEQKRQDIGIGGVFGARYYYPDLDILGSPRLDISIHAPAGQPDLSFIQQIDPALAQSKKRDEHASLVVHYIHRAASLFEQGKKGLIWADPLECLMDLHDAHLEDQAFGFFRYFESRRTIAK